MSPIPTATPEIRNLLSDREIEILRCLVIGYPNKLISRRLDISEATVKVHVKAVLRKLKVQNRTQAAIYALHHGLSGDVGPSVSIVVPSRRIEAGNPAYRLPMPAVIDPAVAA
ncbi:DNA-binding response regulator [Sphingomonas koreensis]|nr:DNA-binding response regulator [Sphingomonas koreensis]